MTNWSFVDNVVTEANVWGGLSDVVIDNDVPVFEKGVPTTKCVPYAHASPGAAAQRGINISGNTFVQISGMSAVGVFSTDGLTLEGNNITYASGAPVPPVDLAGFGVVNAALADNVCGGRACVTAGLGA